MSSEGLIKHIVHNNPLDVLGMGLIAWRSQLTIKDCLFKVKYKPPCQFTGFWSEDIYFSGEALAQVKANTQKTQQTDLKDSKIEEEKIVMPII